MTVLSGPPATDLPGNRRRANVDFDVVVLGATGLTGRLVVEHLLAFAASPRGLAGGCRWAVAGRNPERLAQLLADLGAGNVPIISADLRDAASLERLAARTVVVLNVAGPYTPSAEAVIAACVGAGAAYADLSGEVPLLRRVIDRFDEPARRAGVPIVQMAGWEALPSDLTTLLACQRAAAATAEPGGLAAADERGPGANAPIAHVVVQATFSRQPAGRSSLGQAFSAGTLASLVELLADPDAALLEQPDSLLPAWARTQAHRPAALRLRPRLAAGLVLGPAIPVAFFNPAIVHRTAALLAAEHGAPYRPATYTEGLVFGPVAGLTGKLRWVGAALLSGVQWAYGRATRLPWPTRRWLAARLRKRLPAAGTGPDEHYLRDWEWQVQARATTAQGAVGVATLHGSGHPGYTAAAAMLVETGLSLVYATEVRGGCLTPALAVASTPLPHPLWVSSLTLT